jgi:hypothetical protein
MGVKVEGIRYGAHCSGVNVALSNVQLTWAHRRMKIDARSFHTGKNLGAVVVEHPSRPGGRIQGEKGPNPDANQQAMIGIKFRRE